MSESNDPQAEFTRAAALHKEGKLREAEAIYRGLLAKFPEHPQLLTLLGRLAIDMNAPLQAVTYLNRAVATAPRNPSALSNLANAQATLFSYDTAIEGLERAIAIEPTMQEGWHNLARILNLAGNPDRALDIARRLKAKNTDHVGARLSIVRALSQLARFSEAEAEAGDMISRWPDRAAGYIAMAPLRKFPAGDPLIEQSQRLLDQGKCEPNDIGNLNFALGKMYDDAGRVDDAFRAYSQGNARNAVPYDRANLEAYFSALAQTYSKKLLSERFGQGHASETPLLVVGMPRSGTTLVESILAGHPDVATVGEGPFLRVIGRTVAGFVPREGDLNATIHSLSVEGAEFLGRRYAQSLVRHAHAGAKSRIVDKTPHNFTELGFVGLTLPRAKIIHVRRSPMATCLSCWTQNFNRTHEYTARFDDVAHHYAQYRKLMAHWRDAMGDRILDVVYEDIVKDPAREARRMLEWLGLPSDEFSLDQNRALRVVISASAWQVRQPIHQQSVERWRAYEAHLAPLKQALQDQGIEAA